MRRPGRRISLRRVALFFSLLLLTGFAAWSTERAMQPEALPVRFVTVQGDLQHLARGKLEGVIASQVNGGLLDIDVEDIRKHVEALPWVAGAHVRRVWPDTLRVHVVEHIPLACWGETELLSHAGVRFDPSGETLCADLPALRGPAGSEQLLAARLREWKKRLRDLGFGLQEITLDDRGAWSVRLSSGLLLQLGRREPEQRLRRFVGVFREHLSGQAVRMSAVDLRYTNGLAVRWKRDKPDAGVAASGSRLEQGPTGRMRLVSK